MYTTVQLFNDFEIIHVADKFQVCFKYMKLFKFHDKPQIIVYNRSHRIVIYLCLDIEDATHLKISGTFLLISLKIDQFWFLLVLRIAAAEIC